jgi:hypothetical protein
MVYRWAARLRGNAQACGEELERLQAENNGRLETKMVVQTARDESNPLHRCFEWNDDLAAERYRENQARMVIRSIRIVSENDEGQKDLVRCFVNVDATEEEAQSYVAVTRIADDAELFERARIQFLKDMHAFETRYRQFLGLRKLVERMRIEAEQVAFHETTDQGGTIGAVEARS